MIKNLIDIEKSYINTNHPDFMGSDQSVLNIFEEGSPNNILNISGLNISGNNNNTYSALSVNNINNTVNGNSLGNNNRNNNTNSTNFVENDIKEEKKTFNSNQNNNFIKKKGKDFEEEGLINKKQEEKRLQAIPTQMRPGMPTNRDLMETMIIKNLISSYYHVVKKNINDLVPKTIMCFLVNQSKIMAEKEMVSQLYKSDELASLLHEDPNIAKKRKNCKDTLHNLKKSLEILSDFNEISSD
jgi:hypothetical protein